MRQVTIGQEFEMMEPDEFKDALVHDCHFRDEIGVENHIGIRAFRRQPRVDGAPIMLTVDDGHDRGSSVHLTVGMAQVVADALVVAINRTKEKEND
jgi:hypothetical protein